MRASTLLLSGVAVGAGVAYVLWRRSADAAPEPFVAAPAPPAADLSTAPQPSAADVGVDPNAPGAAPGPEARDIESEATEETRLERLAEREREERRQAAQRLADDPLVQRPEGEAES